MSDVEFLKGIYGVDPFLVACPRCEAKSGEMCVNMSSASKKETRWPHPMRIDAARLAKEGP